MRRRKAGATKVAAAVAMGAAAWLAGGCASRTPFRLRLLTPEVVVEPGGSERVRAVLTNTSRETLRFTEEAKLRHALSCRRPIDAPGEGGLIVGTAFEGAVWGGITDVRPDPDDPFFCRSHPPRTIELAPGGSLRLETLVLAPRSCVEGEAELEVLFRAPDIRRPCPGYWYGETRPMELPARLRHAAAGEAVAPSASPAVLECGLAAQGAGVRLTLRNPGAAPWRARVRPSLEIAPLDDPEEHYWAPLAGAGAEPLVLAAGAEWSREAALAELDWQPAYSERREGEEPFRLPPGSYTAEVWVEVVGGRSWELRCPTAVVELAAP